MHTFQSKATTKPTISSYMSFLPPRTQISLPHFPNTLSLTFLQKPLQMAFFASAFNLRLCLLASLILAPQFLPPISPALLVGLTHHHRNHHHPHKLSPLIETNQTECNLFVGNWVVDESYPLYQSSDCPIIDPEFNCRFYGRPDSNYLMYRWKPATCDLPR